jgi:hypothetical protein
MRKQGWDINAGKQSVAKSEEDKGKHCVCAGGQMEDESAVASAMVSDTIGPSEWEETRMPSVNIVSNVIFISSDQLLVPYLIY